MTLKELQRQLKEKEITIQILKLKSGESIITVVKDTDIETGIMCLSNPMVLFGETIGDDFKIYMADWIIGSDEVESGIPFNASDNVMAVTVPHHKVCITYMSLICDESYTADDVEEMTPEELFEAFDKLEKPPKWIM